MYNTGPNLSHPLRFAGVHRAESNWPLHRSADVEIDTFMYKGQDYYTTGKDSELLKQSYLAELCRFFRPDEIAESPLEITKTYLAKKEPNNRFLQALVAQDGKKAFLLLQNPEVKLSATDDPNQPILADRLLGHKKNLKFLTQQLGSPELAQAMAIKIMAAEIGQDLETTITKGEWGEASDADHRAMAERIATKATNGYLLLENANAKKPSRLHTLWRKIKMLSLKPLKDPINVQSEHPELTGKSRPKVFWKMQQH